MSNIVVVTAAWKRPKVFALFLKNMTAVNPRPKIVVAGSPGDDCESLAIESGCDYFQVDNFQTAKTGPGIRMGQAVRLGGKWNDALEHARGKGDYFMIMGSDDLMSQEMWDYYNRFTGDALGLLDLWFMNLKDKQVLYWAGFPEKGNKNIKPIGCGKMFSHKTLDRMGWRPYGETTKKCMDFQIDAKLKAAGLKYTLVRQVATVESVRLGIPSCGGLSIDVKSSDLNELKKPIQLTQFMRWPNTTYKNMGDIRRAAPDVADIIEGYYNPVLPNVPANVQEESIVIQ